MGKNKRPSNRKIGSLFAGLFLIFLILAGDIITGAVSSHTVAFSTKVNGTNTITVRANEALNHTSILFNHTFANPPSLSCCLLQGNLPPINNFWSTQIVPQQIQNGTSPYLDAFTRHDKNSGACPCTDSLTITPSYLGEALVVNVYYVSDGNAICPGITSVTATGINLHVLATNGIGECGEGEEQWGGMSFTTSPITVTANFNPGTNTLLTDGIVASVWGNSNGFGATTILPTTTCPGQNAYCFTFTPTKQYDAIVGALFVSNATLGCNFPTPGAGLTQVVNDNSFCFTNTNGGLGFLYNYDMEYARPTTAASFNYRTNWNQSSSATSISAVEVTSGLHSRVWAITATNSTLYNDPTMIFPINPPFTGNCFDSPCLTPGGKVFFACSYASANVSLTLIPQFNSNGVNNWIDLPFQTALTSFQGTFFTGNFCDGTIHSGGYEPALSSNALGRILGSCVCPNGLALDITNFFIAYNWVRFDNVNFYVTLITTTGFIVFAEFSTPTPSGASPKFYWSAEGT